jgi:predicted lipoprotein
MSRIIWVLVFPVFAWGAETPEQQFIRYVSDNVLTPAYQNWAKQSQQLSVAAQSFCSDGKNLKSLRQNWRLTQQGWSAVSALLAGPVVANSYSAQIQYWPDKKNLVAFQVENYIKQQTGAETLSRASVALRGLNASEYILFDTAVKLENKDVRKYYCPLLLANTAYQQNFAAHIETEWQDYVTQLRSFPSRRFADKQAVLAELLGAQVAALELQHKKLSVVLGAEIPQPYQAEFWRSAQSLASLRAVLVIEQKLWQDAGWKSLVVDRDEDLALSIDQTYVATFDALDKLPAKNLQTLLATPEGIKAMRNIQAQLDVLQMMYGKFLAKTLGVQIGFNANDGD